MRKKSKQEKDVFSKEEVVHEIESQSTIKEIIQVSLALNDKYSFIRDKYEGETPTQIIEKVCGKTLDYSRPTIRRMFYIERHGNSKEKELLYAGQGTYTLYKNVRSRIKKSGNSSNEYKKAKSLIEDTISNEIVSNINKIKEDFENQMIFWKSSIETLNGIKAEESIMAINSIIEYFTKVKEDIAKWKIK